MREREVQVGGCFDMDDRRRILHGSRSSLAIANVRVFCDTTIAEISSVELSYVDRNINL